MSDPGRVGGVVALHIKVVKLLEFIKVCSPIDVRVSGKSAVTNEVQFLNAPPLILVSPLGIVMDVIPVFLKASVPIDVALIVLGKLTVVRALQS